MRILTRWCLLQPFTVDGGLVQGFASLAELVAERAAIYDEKLTKCSANSDPFKAELTAEYLYIRVLLVRCISLETRKHTEYHQAWKQRRLDMAKLMYAKIPTTTEGSKAVANEKLGDLLFEIGHDQLRCGSHENALFWLESAQEELSTHDIGFMSSDASDLKLNVMHDIVKALISLPGGACSRSWNVIRDMETQFQANQLVSLLKLEHFASLAEFPVEDYCAVLGTVTRSVQLSDTNVKTLLHYVHQLRRWNPSSAQTMLSTLICTRLLNAEEPSWLEKALVTAVWNATTSHVPPDPVATLNALFNEIIASIQKPLSPSAIHATQVLLWRSIEDCVRQSKYDVAGKWCLLGLHACLQNPGTKNIGILQRKLMQCLIGQKDLNQAREIFDRMSKQVQDEDQTRFLLYKVALQSKDATLAQECLKSILRRHREGNDTILYACVLEAQKMGDQAQSVSTLQELLRTHDIGQSDGINLPALLRCTVRMLTRQVHNNGHSTSGLEDTCHLFEVAASHAQKAEGEPLKSTFSTADLNWFSRNAYNLVVGNLTVWPCKYTIRMLDSCSVFLHLCSAFPEDQLLLGSGYLEKLYLRQMFCYFLAASLNIVLARRENALDLQLQHYTYVRNAAEKLRIIAARQLDSLSGELRHDIQRKYASLCVYDFEAAARLKSWDALDYLVKVSITLESWPNCC